MTVSSEQSSVTYTGNGVTTLFTIPYYFLDKTHILVTLTDAAGVVIPKVLNIDYTVSGAGNEAGGSLTFFVAPPNLSSLIIARNVPATQLTEYRPNDDFPAESHERALDKLTMLVQQAFSGLASTNTQLGKTIRTPEAITALPDAASRAGKLLTFDPSGNPVAAAAASGSVTELAIDLANSSDPNKGAGLVGFKRNMLAGAINTVGKMLSSQMLNLWEYANLVVSKPNPNDSGTWDWTPAFVGASADAILFNSLIFLPLGKYNVNANAWTMFRTGGTPAQLDRQSTGVVGCGAGSRVFIVGAGTGLTIGQSGEGGTVSAGRNIVLRDFEIELSANTSTAVYVRTASQVWIDGMAFHANSFRDCQGIHIRDVITIGANELYFRSFGGDLGTAVYIENPGLLTTGNYTFQDVLALDTQKGIWAPASGRGAGQVLNNILISNFKVYNDLGTIGTGAGGYTDDGTYFTQRIGFDLADRVYNVIIENSHVEYKSGETAVRLSKIKNFSIINNMLSGQTAGSMRHCVTLVDSATIPGVENIKIDQNYLQASSTGIYVGKNSTGISIGNNKTNGVTTYIVRDSALSNGEGLPDIETAVSFTPVITGSTAAGAGTYSVQNGVFSRNKNMVSFIIQLTWSAHTGTGFLQIDGLPYLAYGGIPQSLNVIASNITFTGQIACLTATGLARLLPYRIISGSPIAQLNMSTSGTLYISGTYAMA